MRKLFSFIPNKLLTWNLIFLTCLLLTIAFAFAVNTFEFSTIPYLAFGTYQWLLFLLSLIFLLKSPGMLLGYFRNRSNTSSNIIFLNVLLLFPTLLVVIPSVLIHGMPLAFQGNFLLVNAWRGFIYKEMSFQQLDHFPYSGDYFKNEGMIVDNEQEYLQIKEAILAAEKKRLEEFPELAYEDYEEEVFPFPKIDFEKNVILSNGSEIGCSSLEKGKVYRDDRGKRIIYVINIARSNGPCLPKFEYGSEAILVPKVPGYKIEFMVTRSIKWL